MNKSLYKVLHDRWCRRDKSSPYVFQFSTRYLRHMMKDLCQKAQVTYFGFTAIRHAVSSLLADSKKASMVQIQKLMRHQRASTTETYLHLIEESVREAAGFLNDEAVHHSTPKADPEKGKAQE